MGQEGKLNVRSEVKARTLATNIRSDLSKLQIAIIKENKHDIGEHLSTVVERAEELVSHLAVYEGPQIVR